MKRSRHDAPMEGKLENRDGAWVLTLVRDFGHPPEKVWPWLTDPDRLRPWSPIVPDRRSTASARGRCGRTRRRTGHRRRDGVDPPQELVHRWGDDLVRWRLSPTDTGCRLTLEQTMRERDPAAMNAAGWHLCLDVLDDAATARTGRGGRPGRRRHGWEALRDNYAEALGD